MAKRSIAPRSERFSETDVPDRVVPTSSDVDPQVQAISSELVTKTRSDRAERAPPFAKVGRNRSNTDESRNTKAFGQTLSILSLHGYQKPIAIDSRLVATQIRARSERRIHKERRLTGSVAQRDSGREKSRRRERVVMIGFERILLVLEIRSKCLSSQRDFGCCEQAVRRIELIVSGVVGIVRIKSPLCQQRIG